MPAAQALSMFQSILLSFWQSINHDNALYISNYLYNSYLCIGHYHDHETLIMPELQSRSLSVLKSILLTQGQSINHDNALYISNYYFYFIEGIKTF